MLIGLQVYVPGLDVQHAPEPRTTHPAMLRKRPTSGGRHTVHTITPVRRDRDANKRRRAAHVAVPGTQFPGRPGALEA